MIRRSYGDRMQCWPSGINCQNFVLDKGTISEDSVIFFYSYNDKQIYKSSLGKVNKNTNIII